MPSFRASDDESQDEHLAAAIAGDRAALERLLLDHYAPLAARIQPLIPASLRPVVEVDDVLQQAFAQVFRDIARYQTREGASFLDWIGTIAQNRLRDEIRSQRRKKRGGDRQRVTGASDSSAGDLVEALLADDPTASRSLARREAIHALQVALAQLPSQQQQAVRLHLLEGISLADTAQRMNCTSGAIRGLLDRAKQNLRAALGRASLYLTSK